MKHERTVVGVLQYINRLPSSMNGNPRFDVSIDGERFSTQVDAMLGYSIQNHFGQLVRAKVGYYYGVPCVETIETMKGENMKLEIVKDGRGIIELAGIGEIEIIVNEDDVCVAIRTHNKVVAECSATIETMKGDKI
jgi:hypothetical protein